MASCFTWRAMAWTVCITASAVFAQETASITGTVRDSSGASVSGATSTASNRATGFTRSAPTGSGGAYNLESLPIGAYEVSATLTGFKVTKAPNVVLEVAQQARVDLELTPGDVSSAITVSAEPSLITTDTASLGQVINNKQIVDLPLNGRNFIQLAALTPGALTSGGPGGPASGEQTGSSTVSVSGGQSSKTEFLLDGITNQDQLYDGAVYSPSTDFIQEFRVQSNAFRRVRSWRCNRQREFPQRTNAVHGTAFEFFRNNVMNAEKLLCRGGTAAEEKSVWSVLWWTDNQESSLLLPELRRVTSARTSDVCHKRSYPGAADRRPFWTSSQDTTD